MHNAIPGATARIPEFTASNEPLMMERRVCFKKEKEKEKDYSTSREGQSDERFGL